MSRRTIGIIGLIVLDVSIVVICAMLPPREWLNYVVVLSMAITAYLLWLGLDHAALRHLGPAVGFRAQPVWRKLAVGVVLGAGSMIVITALIWMLRGFAPGTGYQEFAVGCRETLAASSRSDADMMYVHNVGMALVIHGFNALFEEILFRAVGMGLPMMFVFWLSRVIRHRRESTFPLGEAGEAALRWNRRIWLSTGIVTNLAIAVCFGLIHRGSPGATTVSLINVTLSGLVYGQLFILQGSILGAWTMHWFWNATQSVLGLPVSGTLVANGPLLGAGFHGAREGMLGGGMYGPEGSLIAIIVQLAILTWLGWSTWRKRMEMGTL